MTDGNGLNIPKQKLIISVTDVIVIDTAASLNVLAILVGTSSFIDVLLQAANITNVSSIPIPKKKKKKEAHFAFERFIYLHKIYLSSRTVLPN